MADRLVERTEGWPAALYLAALVATEALEPILDISGDDVYVSDYLHREALSRLAGGRCRRSSSAPRSWRGSRPTPATPSWSRPPPSGSIRDIEASNLFLVPLDRRRSWYRYHPLFREFLLSELRRIEPDLEPALHRRAAAWFAANDEPESAVSHLFLAGDHDAAVPLVQENIRRVHNQGRVATTQNWLEELGPERIARHPAVAILACWQAALSGDAAEALRIAGWLDEAELAPTPIQALGVALLSALCRDGIDTMTADAELALSIETPTSVARPGALTGLGEAHLAAGRTDEGEALIGQAVQVGRYPDNSLSLILGLADLAWFAMDRRDWNSASESLARAVDLVDRSGTTEAIPALFVDVAAARLALHRGDQDRATVLVHPCAPKPGDRHLCAADIRDPTAAPTGDPRPRPGRQRTRQTSSTGNASPSSNTGRSWGSWAMRSTPSGDNSPRPRPPDEAGRRSPRRSFACFRTCRPT